MVDPSQYFKPDHTKIGITKEHRNFMAINLIYVGIAMFNIGFGLFIVGKLYEYMPFDFMIIVGIVGALLFGAGLFKYIF
jgi:hypothetical protein